MQERCYNVDSELLREKVNEIGGVTLFAKKIGYKKQRVSHWMTGFNRVPESAVPTICRELGITPAILINDETFKNFVTFVYR